MKKLELEKKVIALQPEVKTWLEKKAQELCMTTNQLIRIIINDYMKKEK